MAGAKGNPAIYVEVASRLRMLRLANGMSQDDIGRIIGVTFQQVQKYENATNKIAIDKLHAIADILKVPLGYFFETIPRPNGDGAVEALECIKHICADPMGFRMAQAFLRLSDRKRRAAVEILEDVAGIQPTELE